MTWHRIGPDVLSVAEAVARGVGLLDRLQAGVPVVSWSQVDRPGIVLGRAARQPPLNHAELERCEIAVATRASGGGPVLWDAGLLGLDIAVPAGHDLAGRDVTEAYRWLGEAVAAGLTASGVAVRAVSIDEARRDAARADALALHARRACFGGLSPYEVVAPDDRKVVGLSQVRRQSGTLFQCGIAMSFDADRLARLMEADAREAGLVAAALRARAAGLDQYRAAAAVEEVISHVEAAIEGYAGVVIG